MQQQNDYVDSVVKLGYNLGEMACSLRDKSMEIKMLIDIESVVELLEAKGYDNKNIMRYAKN